MSRVQTKAQVLHRKPPETHRVKVSISISPTTLAQLDERAAAMDFPRSLIIQQALREYFAK